MLTVCATLVLFAIFCVALGALSTALKVNKTDGDSLSDWVFSAVLGVLLIAQTVVLVGVSR